MVEAALAMPSPAVQRAAVAAAGAAAQRARRLPGHARAGADVAGLRAAPDRVLGGAHARRSRPCAVPERARSRPRCVGAARAARRGLGRGDRRSRPSVGSAVQVLQDPDASRADARARASQIKAALTKDPGAAMAALLPLIGQERAPAEARIFALDAAHRRRSIRRPTASRRVANAVRAAFQSHSVSVRAAALPVYAKLDPGRAGGDLTDDARRQEARQAAEGRGRARVGRGRARRTRTRRRPRSTSCSRTRTATCAPRPPRRRASSAASYQDKLIKMAKAENYNVRIGAAEGLANTRDQRRQRPGRRRRHRAAVAREGPAAARRREGLLASREEEARLVLEYLASAAQNTEDPALHPIGVEGLCDGRVRRHAGCAARARAVDRRSERRGPPRW